MIPAEMEAKTPRGPRSDEEKEQVRRQMQRLLETTHFKNSRRYPALFRFIVEETLEGRGEFLKERLLGVRVFNRPPDYDTANDPIVRVTIAEIRKRIAQYYHEPGHEGEMRIELMPGHYEPAFHPCRAQAGVLEEQGHDDPRPTSPQARPSDTLGLPAAAAISPPLMQRMPLLALLVRGGMAGAVLILLALVSSGLWRFTHPSAIQELWEPVLAVHRTVTFCIPTGSAHRGSEIATAAGIVSSRSNPALLLGATTTGPGGAPAATFLDHENDGENVVFSDALASQKISDWMARHGRESRLRSGNSTTLYDLQQGPAVLIGGMDNEWTLRAISRLRYRFLGTDREQYWIMDSKDPSRRDWGLDLKSRYSAVKNDFALIARVHDQSTGQIQVIVAGIGMSGTAAAGEFLVNAEQAEQLRSRIGPGFRDHDFEAVLGTDVVNGIPGSAKILAVAVW